MHVERNGMVYFDDVTILFWILLYCNQVRERGRRAPIIGAFSCKMGLFFSNGRGKSLGEKIVVKQND